MPPHQIHSNFTFFNTKTHFHFLQSLIQSMQNESKSLQYQAIENDSFLNELYQNQRNQDHYHPHQTSLIQTMNTHEHPSRYDQKDLEKDYRSQCPDTTRKIRKPKKGKMIVNQKLKNDRKRKDKLYIEMLENRVFELQREIENLKKQNTFQREQIRKSDDSEQIVNGFFIHRQKHYEKLVNYMKERNESESCEDKYIQEFNALRMRQGAFGIDRIKTINYYFKELSEIFLPDLQKYILKTASDQIDIFDPHFIKHGNLGAFAQKWRKEMIKDLQLGPEKVLIVSLLREEFLKEKANFSTKFEEFYQMKCQLMQSSRLIEKISDRVHGILSPKQIAKCLCLLEKFKFQKGFSMEVIFPETFQKLNEEESQKYNPHNLYESLG